MQLQHVISSKPAVIIHSCDKYNWILPEFFSYFYKNFPFELNWPIYFCNEVMNVELQNGIKHIKTGIGSWSSRLRNILEQIEEKHILYIQEDFFLLNCYGPLINEIYKLHNQHSLDITKLASNYEFTLNRIDSPFDGVNAYQQMPGLYIMSHQPVAFFNKKFLLNTLFDGDYGPSEHEIESTKNFIEEQNMPKILCLGPIMNPNKSLIFTIHHAIYKGVYCPISQS